MYLVCTRNGQRYSSSGSQAMWCRTMDKAIEIVGPGRARTCDQRIMSAGFIAKLINSLVTNRPLFPVAFTLFSSN